MELTQNAKICPLKLAFNNKELNINDLFETQEPKQSVIFTSNVENDVDISILRSKMTFIFYIIASIVEGKAIIPKSSYFINCIDFDPIKLNSIQDIFIEFIKADVIKSYLSNSIYDNDYILDGFTFKILKKIKTHNVLFFASYIKIYEDILELTDSELFKEIVESKEQIKNLLMQKLNNKDVVFDKLASYLYKNFNSNTPIIEDLIDDLTPISTMCNKDFNLNYISIYNEYFYNCFNGMYIDDFKKSNVRNLIDFIFSEYDYYRFPKTDQFFGPLDYHQTIIEKESKIFSDHLTSLNCEYIPHFIKYFKLNKRFSEKDKKIVHNFLPREIRVFENYSYMNLLTYLKRLEVNNNLLNSVLSLKDSFPHFSEVIDYLDISIRANLRKNSELKFKPILLIGDNGIGKSAFIDEINKIFNLSNNTVNIGSITTPAEISGSTSLWNSGQPGFISKVLTNNNVYNPIIILEELDKVMSGNYNGRVMAPLYDLFEKRSAEKFFENFYAIPLDFSNINFIATANKYENIDKGILHRFKIFKIERPHEDELFDIVKSVYKNIKDNDLFDIVEINDTGLKAISNSFVHQKIRNVRVIYKFIEDILMEALYHNKTNDIYVIDYLDDSYINHSNMIH